MNRDEQWVGQGVRQIRPDAAEELRNAGDERTGVAPKEALLDERLHRRQQQVGSHERDEESHQTLAHVRAGRPPS
jgi:hypothetical protein